VTVVTCRKRSYRTKEAAKRAMKANRTLNGDGRPNAKAYRCEACGMWHWGHSSPKVQQARKSETQRAERHLSLVEPVPSVAPAPKAGVVPRKPRCVKCGRWWLSDLDWTTRCCPWPCGGEIALVRERVAA
jgi:hypothetical protein